MKIYSALALVAAGVAAATSLTACSSSNSTSDAASASPSASLVGGMTTCDNATITDALTKVINADGAGNKVSSIDKLQCDNGWAAVEATTGDGTHDVTSTHIFKAEGQFWIPQTYADVCGTVDDSSTTPPANATIPASLFVLGCETN